MTAITPPAPFGLPIPGFPLSTISAGTTSLNAAANEVVYIFQMPATDTITSWGYIPTTVTAPPTYVATIEATTNGNPNGTVIGTATSTFTPTSDTTAVFNFRTFDSAGSASLTAGTFYALRIAYSTGTIGASNLIVVQTVWTNAGDQRNAFTAKTSTNTGTSWTATSATPQVFALRSSTTTYMMIAESFPASTYSSTNEIGLRFTIPGSNGTYNLHGIRYAGQTPKSTDTIYASCYSGITASNPTLISQGSITGTTFPTNNQVLDTIMIPFTSDATLNFGTEYAVTLANSGSTSLPDLVHLQMNSSGDLTSLPFGSNFYACSRTISAIPPTSTGNAFASSGTQQKQRPWMELLISDITATGGGGGTVDANLATGAQGLIYRPLVVSY